MATSVPPNARVGDFPCPNCGAQVLRLRKSPVSDYVDTLRCETCGWSKLACPECGKPIEFRTGKYRCSKCDWMSYGSIFLGDSDGAPKPGLVRDKPLPPPTKCNRCGAPIQPGDWVIKHKSNPALMACAKCAAEGGYSNMLQRYR
jgi:predicted RNA-binding Zn-ribbon protein involved in translation (DUF1610 family)